MSKIFDFKAKKENKSGKVHWLPVGMTLFLNDEGKMSVHDARNNQTYYVYERDQSHGQEKPKAAPPAARPDPFAQTGQPESTDFDDDINF